MKLIHSEKGFIAFLSLLLTVAIICFLAYKVYIAYLNKPSIDAQTKKAVAEQGIDTSSAVGVLESAKTKIHSINNMLLQQENDAFDQAR